MSDTIPARIVGSPGSPGAPPIGKLVLAGALVIGVAVLAALILTNDFSIVTRGPANANASLNAGWQIVKDPNTSPSALEAVEIEARKTLQREPLNSAAMSLIGAIRERQGKPGEAEALMNAAADINHRENIADLWLFDHLLSEKKYDAAFANADSLLRRDAEFTGRLFPSLVTSLRDPGAVTPLARRLAKDPAWRVVFTDELAKSGADPAAMVTLYSAIKTAGGAIKPQEFTDVLTRLIATKRYEEAYLDWIIFLPDKTTSKLTYVYDGDFSGLPDTRPFGWNFSDGVGGVIETPPDRSDPALHIAFNGQPAHSYPAQLLVIAPGRYALTGEVMTATPATPGSMQWTVQCVGQPDVIASAAAPNTSGKWIRFSVAFTILSGCPAQVLSLKANSIGHQADIDIWYDKLNVQPAEGGA